jgi:hypothetical protein
MNFTRACSLLDIPVESINPLNKEIVKKQYRRKALQYHPDKNNGENTTAEFLLIKEAYHYLDNDTDMDESINYETDLFSFLKQSLNGPNENIMQSKIFQVILRKIIECCEMKALNILEKIDKKFLIKIYEIFKNHADIMNFSEGFLKSVEQVLLNKIQNDECVILNPFLDDLWENNLYKMAEKGGTFLIPLWHHELVYDNSGCDLYVKIVPVLPDNVKIDEKNNIHVDLSYDIRELWSNSNIDFCLGKKQIRFNSEQLYIKKNQSVILHQQGITNINVENIYDISRKSDIIVHIEIS